MAASKVQSRKVRKDTEPATLHGRTEERLRKYLTSGKIAVGDKLPPELELCGRLDVSRNTLRTALHALEREGYLMRKKRVGTVVLTTAPPTNFAIDLSSVSTIRDYLRRTAFEDRIVGHFKIPDSVQRACRVASREKWMLVSGIRRELLGHRVVAGVDLYVNPEYAAEASAYGQATNFLYEVIEDSRKDRVSVIEIHIVPVPMPERWATKLGDPVGTPVLNLVEVVRRNDGVPLEVFSIVFSATVQIDFALAPHSRSR